VGRITAYLRRCYYAREEILEVLSLSQMNVLETLLRQNEQHPVAIVVPAVIVPSRLAPRASLPNCFVTNAHPKASISASKSLDRPNSSADTSSRAQRGISPVWSRVSGPVQWIPRFTRDEEWSLPESGINENRHHDIGGGSRFRLIKYHDHSRYPGRSPACDFPR
jgi:hypothetical protein